MIVLADAAPPRADASCHGSPFRLGSDNVSIAASETGAIVNAWYIRDAQGNVGAWVYRTADKKYWLQMRGNGLVAQVPQAIAQRPAAAQPCFSGPLNP